MAIDPASAKRRPPSSLYLAALLAGTIAGPALGQVVDTGSVPSLPALPAYDAPAVAPPGPLDAGGGLPSEMFRGDDAGPSGGQEDGAAAARQRSREATGFFGVARASIFGPTDYAPWQPLRLATLFSEGWDQSWIAPPDGSGGAVRQGWIGAADGNFYRLYWFSYIEAFHVTSGNNGYISRFNLYTPLSRRLMLITTVPYVNANSPSFNLGTADFGSSGAAIRGQRAQGTGTSFGDLTLTPRVMLAETRDLSLSAQVTIQIPTGSTRSSAGKAIISPALQFWRDIGNGWALRGAFNSSTGVNKPGIGQTLVSQLAVGRTITPHDRPIFGDFTYYLAANISNQTAPKSLTTVTLGPGFRTHLGRDYYLLGAVTVPVTGPPPFDESATIWLMKTF